MRILLVDDEQELVSTLAERLSIRGIEADWETNPEVALGKIEKNQYDIAILDMKMPGMSGPELKGKMEEIRPAMKFVFMTGHGSAGAFEKGDSQADDDCYLAKPVNLEVLMNTVKEILKNPNEDYAGDNWELIGEKGFQFFGKISASVSHEIKNVLAIINENSGLLQDLIFMSERGTPIDPMRLQQVSELISKQVQRADTIVKNMNTFAHSTDDSVKTLNLQELTGTVLALSDRFADMKGVVLERQPADTEVIATTRPFLLENLIWLCLDFAMSMTGSEKRVIIDLKKKGKQASITLSGLQDMKATREILFPGDAEKALTTILQAEIILDTSDGRIEILLPENAA